MKICVLLEKLISIAKKSKTDFAMHMNITPSGLSKILAGTSLPSIKERMAFTRHAADYFSEAIYSSDCHIKLKGIFPAIYDFKGQPMFHSFLVDAIVYALDFSYAAENGLDFRYTDRGKYYVGSKMVLNQLCIALSDCVDGPGGEPLEAFVSFPLSSNIYAKLFKEIIWRESEGSGRTVVNYFFDSAQITELNNVNANELFERIASMQRFFDLNLYKTNVKPENYLLVKDKLLLLLYVQNGDIPVLVPIYNKSQINIFYHKIIQGGHEKISYSKREAIDLLEKNPQLIDELIDRGIDSVYNFTSIGYLLTKQDFHSIQCSPDVCDAMLKLFSAVLTGKNTCFNVSINAMENFALHGNIVAPLIENMIFPPAQRAAYLKRFNEYLSEGYYRKVKILSSKLSNIALLCFQEFCLIYTVDDISGQEKIHIVKDMTFSQQVQSKLLEEAHTGIEFTADIWSIYLDRLINGFY